MNSGTFNLYVYAILWGAACIAAWEGAWWVVRHVRLLVLP